MSLGLDDPKKERQLQSFLDIETQKQKYQHLLQELTERCWDSCMDQKPSQRLEPKTETCLRNCVERFLDATNFVVNRLEKTPSLASLASSDTEFIPS